MSAEIANKTGIFVRLNGTPIVGLLSVSISTTNCFSADTFSFTFALHSTSDSDLAYWSSTPTAYAEINVVENSGITQQLAISGMVDTVLVDPIRRTVAMEGRDLSSSLIDCYRQTDYVNQTASEVVQQIAQNHSLIPIVSPTAGSVGRYFGDGYTRLALAQFSRLRSDWDLVVELARENGFDAFVQGRLLYFQPTNSMPPNVMNLLLSDVTRIRVERSLGTDTNFNARVQSWDSQKMTSYDSGSNKPASVAMNVTSADNNQPFIFSRSNFTLTQVNSSAERLTTELNRLKTVLRFEMPWDMTLSPRSHIVFDDLHYLFNRPFVIDSIERRFSSITGSMQSIHAIIT